MTKDNVNREDHWQLTIETIELSHKHQHVHSHPFPELEQGKLGDVSVAHFHNPEGSHIHEMILTPTDNGYEITHPALI